jgi:hypothetical protein
MSFGQAMWTRRAGVEVRERAAFRVSKSQVSRRSS